MTCNPCARISPGGYPRIRSPGGQFSYTDHAITLAGDAVEQVSGIPFADSIGATSEAAITAAPTTITATDAADWFTACGYPLKTDQ